MTTWIAWTTSAATSMPEAEIGGAAAGLHVAVGLPPGADVDAISARAAKRGVGVLKAPHSDRPLLLVGYANIADSAIEPGVRELAAAVRVGESTI